VQTIGNFNLELDERCKKRRDKKVTIKKALIAEGSIVICFGP
jgi:hypothetical protein